MNYKKHYEQLIEQAKLKNRSGEYTEKHHILPKCMGGGDSKDNIISLTGREHFIAHLLLMKAYPQHSGLVFAAHMMFTNNSKRKLSKNRTYAKLKHLFAKEMSKSQSGENNSQYGNVWMYNIELRQSKLIKQSLVSGYISNNWIKGRRLNFDIPRSQISGKGDYYKKVKLCHKCGQSKCVHPSICKKRTTIATLVTFFGLCKSSFGSLRFYDEFFRIKSLIDIEYNVNKLSVVEIAQKYNIPSHQRMYSIFKSLGIETRNHTDATNNHNRQKK